MTVPIGTIMAYAGDVTANARTRLESQGWLVCDGSDKSKAEYPELDRTIGAYYGNGKSAAYIKLPDLRGRFLRGVDTRINDDDHGRDPDAYSRQASAPGGNKGNQVGSVQEDAMQAHKHEDAGHGHANYHVYLSKKGNRGGETSESDEQNTGDNYHENKHGHAQIGEPVESSGGSVRYTNETRPKNIYVNWIIKAKDV